MLNHVLVPLDGSPLAEEALEYALKIVSPSGRLTLVTAVDLPDVLPPGFYPAFGPHAIELPAAEASNYQYSRDAIVTKAKAYLQTIIGKLQLSSPVRMTAVVEIGVPAELILKVVEQYDVDAVVISTHGRTGISRWFSGSVTAKILQAAHCPVFVIPSRYRRQPELQTEPVEQTKGH